MITYCPILPHYLLSGLPQSATLFVLVLHGSSQVGALLFLRGLEGLEVESFLKLLGQMYKDILDVFALFGRTLHIG